MDIDVKTGKLRERAGDQKNIRNELNRINSSVQTSRRKLRSCLSSSASGKIDKSLDVACKSLQNITNWIGDMADGLDTIAGLYEAAEQDISGNKPSGEAVKEVENQAEEWTGIKWLDVIIDFFKDLFGAGLLGTIVNGIGNIIGADNWIDKMLGFLKLGNGIVSKAAKKEKDVPWKDIIVGEWKVGKAESVNAAKKGAESAKSVVKTVAKWVGKVLTVGEKFVGNVKEFGGDVTKGSSWGAAFQDGRFWKETIMESFIEIGKDVLIGAAVAAVIGTGGWAIVATAAISILLDVGANAIAKNDKGFTENLSDFYIDMDDKAMDYKRKAVTNWFSGNAAFVTM